jgi:uncharacterized protein (TIGR03437 family)
LRLVLAITFGVPCAAQNAFVEAGGNPAPGGIQIGQRLQIGKCTYATPVLATPAAVDSPSASFVWLVQVGCPPTTELLTETPFAGSAVPDDAAKRLTAAAAKSVANPPPAGAGSEPQATATLASGSYLAAWITGAKVNTGVFTSASANTTVSPLAAYTVGPTPEHAIAADFNGDGIADLAVSNYGSLSTNAGGIIAIFLGKGDGTFTAGPTTSAATPVAMYAADFNGDGKMDLAYADVNDAQIVVLLGNGNGTFQAPVSYALPAAYYPESIVSADFRGIGKLDLAVAIDRSVGGPGSVAILPGNGDGTFQPAKTYGSWPGAASYLAWTDVNGDGKPDLIVANSNANAISFLFGNGDGTFQAPVEYATGAGPQYFGLGASGGQLQIGTVDDDAGGFVATPVNASGIAGAPPIYQLPQAATGVAAADLNGDGFPDMVAADQAISIVLRAPAGAFNAPVNYALQSGSQAVTVAVGDINGDGKPDVVAASSTTDQFGNQGGTLDVAAGNGNGTLGTQSSYALGGYPGGGLTPTSGVAIADFNGDGKPDVAAGYQPNPSENLGGTGGISVFVNKGGGALAPAVNYQVGGLASSCTLTGDFNGDGKPDLAVCGINTYASTFTPGAIGVLLGNGDGTFQNAVLTQVGSPAGIPLAAAAADVNGDGKLDLVVTVQSSTFVYTVAVLLGNGNGTFRALTPFTVPVSGSALALLDWNGDGIPDLAVGDCNVGESVYMLGNGDGTFESPIYFSSGACVLGMSVTSWNGDGIAGLAIAQKSKSVEALESMLNPKLYSSAPTLSVAKSHTGNFTAGQQGTYTIAVSNAAGAAPVAGAVTVTDTLPSGLTLVSMTGNNWTCSTNTCTRNDALAGGSSYDPIAVTVNVAANAASPQVNMASVSGGGSAGASASDTTIVGSGGQNSGTPGITSGGVVSASEFGEFASAAPGSWIEIYGTNLASDSRSWQASDFTGVNAPTMLDGTSVTIGGQAAFLDYISPLQVNAQVPNVTAGTQPLVVTAGGNKSASYNLTIRAVDPGLLAPSNFNIGGVQYAYAVDGSTYVLPTGAIAGVSSAPAKPGDEIVLYGVGFGPVSPAIPEGQIVGQQNALPSFSISIGGAPATVRYAGLAPNYVGLYQFNIVVPAITANNAAPVTFQVNGTAGAQTLYLAVE